MVYTRAPDYLYRRNGIYYFTRNVPSDLQTRLNKDLVFVRGSQTLFDGVNLGGAFFAQVKIKTNICF